MQLLRLLRCHDLSCAYFRHPMEDLPGLYVLTRK